MNLKWTDINEIAENLVDLHPDIDPLTLRFTQLHSWVLELPNFEDDPKRSNEAILEAIQMAWLEEKE